MIQYQYLVLHVFAFERNFYSISPYLPLAPPSLHSLSLSLSFRLFIQVFFLHFTVALGPNRTYFHYQHG